MPTAQQLPVHTYARANAPPNWENIQLLCPIDNREWLTPVLPLQHIQVLTLLLVCLSMYICVYVILHSLGEFVCMCVYLHACMCVYVCFIATYYSLPHQRSPHSLGRHHTFGCLVDSGYLHTGTHQLCMCVALNNKQISLFA